jgi:two-component system, NarL family, invasion response regulator UvrY
MESGKLKVIVADDHGVVRSGIKKSLSEKFPEAEFGEARNSAEILKLLNNEKWDLAILDISMPGRNGIEVLKEIKENHPGVPVIIFSMYPEDQFALRAIQTGASAYLTKDVSPKKLSEVVTRVLRGETYYTPNLMDLMTNELRHDHEKPCYETLSDRECQVFLLIAAGKTVTGIARELSLSVKTISVYRSNILKKMNLKNNSEITYYAFKNNLVN